MQEKSRIAQELELTKNIHMLAKGYEEISVMRMQAIRGLVLKTRIFVTELSEVFYSVKTSYRKQIVALMRKQKKKDLTKVSTMRKNGKSVLVLLTTNKKFYGDITMRVFKLFIEDAKRTHSDLVIIGRYGRNLFEHQGILRSYQYFQFPERRISLEDLKPLIATIVPYEAVTVYHGKFKNIVSQVPTASNVTGEQPFEQQPKEQVSMKYMFEPSLEKIISFFETQIFTSLFKQTVHESELAYYASRIKAMEESLENIKNTMSNLHQQKRRIDNIIMNKKQMQALSGITLWQQMNT